MGGTIGLVAWSTGGPVLRPGVIVTPGAAAIGMAVMLAIGWPLLTERRAIGALVAGQGAVCLAIVGVAHDVPCVGAIAAWAAACIVAGVMGRFVRDAYQPVAWVSMLGVVAVAAWMWAETTPASHF